MATKRTPKRKQTVNWGTLEGLKQEYPIGALVLYQFDGQADLGIVLGHDEDGLGRPYVKLPGRRTAYRTELVERLTKAQARELYQYAFENHGRLPRCLTVAGEEDL